MRPVLHVAVGAAAFAAAVFALLRQDVAPGAILLCVALGGLAGLAGRAADRSPRGAAATALILASALVVLLPFLQPNFLGSGDARDYFRMFSDYIGQSRAGVRAVFVGQTAFAFEGTVHTTRTSPLFYHAGVLFDLLSLRSLAPLALEKIVLFGILGAAGLACYLCATRGFGLGTAPAAILACTYVSAPAVLAPLYFSDMVATFTALPFLPLFLTGVVLLGENPNGKRAWLLVGVGSGGLFWTHPAVAIWSHLAALFCLALNLPRLRALRLSSLLRAIPIVLVVAYPIYSAIQLGASSVINPGDIAFSLRHYYGDNPGKWTHAVWISALPTGSSSYTDWCYSWVFGAPVLAAWLALLLWGRRDRPLWPLFATAAVMVFLMDGFPSPAAAFLWKCIPDVVVRITLNWPLQRFNGIVTAIAIVGVARVLAQRSRTRNPEILFIALGCSLPAINLAESWHLKKVPESETVQDVSTRGMEDPDNVVIPFSNYIFLNQGLAFRYLSIGRSDPLSEIRLHEQARYEHVVDIFDSRGPVAPVLHRDLAYDGFNRPVCDPVAIPPGSTAILTFAGLGAGKAGLLQIRTEGIVWEYPLPLNPNLGEASFGTGPHCRRSLLVRNSHSVPKILEIYYWPPPEQQASGTQLGSLTAYPVRESDRYLDLRGLTPLQIDVDAPFPTVLESPRIYQRGYRAFVDGREVPVSKSPQGLVEFRVPSGPHNVRVSFVAEPPLKWTYRFALAGWAYFAGLGAFRLARNPQSLDGNGA